jgi:flagellin-like protein
MKPSNLFNSDDRAVSPVIGVILMVAITVILAAVIGTFVLGLGDSLGDNQPTAQISVDVESDGTNGTVTVEHNGGDPIESDDLEVIITPAADGDLNGTAFASRFSVGDTRSATFAVDGGSTEDVRVRIIHTPSDSIIVDRTQEVDNWGQVTSGETLSFS